MTQFWKILQKVEEQYCFRAKEWLFYFKKIWKLNTRGSKYSQRWPMISVDKSFQQRFWILVSKALKFFDLYSKKWFLYVKNLYFISILSLKIQRILSIVWGIKNRFFKGLDSNTSYKMKVRIITKTYAVNSLNNFQQK